MISSFYEEKDRQIVHLHVCLTEQQFGYIIGNQYKSFSPRFFAKKIILSTLHLEKAQRLAKEVNNWSKKDKVIHIARFLVNKQDIIKYANGSLDNYNTYIVVRPDDLLKFNQIIIGFIECIDRIETGVK